MASFERAQLDRNLAGEIKRVQENQRLCEAITSKGQVVEEAVKRIFELAVHYGILGSKDIPLLIDLFITNGWLPGTDIHSIGVVDVLSCDLSSAEKTAALYNGVAMGSFSGGSL